MSRGCLGLDPAVVQRVLLLRGLALGVAVGGGEVGVLLGDRGPEEGAGVCAGEVHGHVEVVRGHWHDVAGRVLVVDEEGGAGRAGLHLGANLALQQLVARVLFVLDARVKSFGGSALRRLLNHLH